MEFERRLKGEGLCFAGSGDGVGEEVGRSVEDALSFVGEFEALFGLTVMLIICGLTNVKDTTRAVSSCDLRLEALDVVSRPSPCTSLLSSMSRSRRESS